MPADARLALAVTHADEPVGGCVAAALARDATDVTGLSGAELRAADLKAAFHGLDAVVHLAAATAEPLECARRVLDAAGDAAVPRLVVVTSALVYGAWPGNPVPLTDDAGLRPNPGFAPATELGEVERLVSEWRDAHPAATVVVLRPAPTVVDDDPGWLARMLATARSVPVGAHDPPAQFLHADDLAGAVAVAVRTDLGGPCNVAPEGWIEGEDLRRLAGLPPVRLPGRLAERWASWRWRAGMSPTPPGLLPWTIHPWVVASDRLRAAGWVPAHTNAEAFVACHPPAPWATVSPRRRQELALGATAVAAVGAGVAVAAKLRRRR